ncbi:alpha/beta hydrolase [Bdellovibrio sp. HCB337]|uniref:alpha/beta hydrolase n=1 Tax=Bdellovibrio sp. HCB337 TaxID=3394358 RepID=UPI0039A596D8
MIVFLSILKVLFVITLIYFAALYFSQERIIFYPEKIEPEYTFRFKNKFEEKWLQVQDSKVHSLYFEAPNAPGIILYFHGNGGALDTWGELASDYVDQTGWSIWIVDYPGYGKSSGKITSEAQLHEMAAIMYDEAKKFAPNQKVVLYGRSLGSGLATRLASEKTVDGVVLETPYFNIRDLAYFYYPYVPSFILRYKFSSNEWVKNIKSPILFIHGTDDRIIPYAEGKKLFDMTPGPKEFFTIEGGQHNALPTYSEYWKTLKRFLDQLSGKSNTH